MAPDFLEQVLRLYDSRFGKPKPGERYPHDVYHRAPELMRERGISAAEAIDAVLAGAKPAPGSFGPRAEFPEK